MAMSRNERLRHTRLRYDLTLEELGKFIGVTKSYLSMVENNKTELSESKFMEILNGIYKLGEKKREEKEKKAITEQIIELIVHNKKDIDFDRLRVYIPEKLEEEEKEEEKPKKGTK